MSILIKDMEVPKRCCECRLSTCHSFKERPLCDVLVKYMSYGEWEAKRLDDCPLVPVPPSGRLIDADEFYEALTMDDRVSIIEAIHVKSILSEVPTVIPAEEVEES